MEDVEKETIVGVICPGSPLIISLENFFDWAEAAFREGRDHQGDFRKCLGISGNDFSNWKTAVWTGKNAWSRQIAVTERLLAVLSYDGTHASYTQKGSPKKVRGADWRSYASAPNSPNRDEWEKITSEKIRLLQGYYQSLVSAEKDLKLRKATGNARTHSEAFDHQKVFVRALTQYVALLVKQGKMSTVLHIRESMSHLLHLLGEHQTRFDLGEMALMAAVDTGSTLDRAQILLDDLGWAAHVLSQEDVARENIQSGIRIANAHETSNVSDLVEARLTAAKGYRHLAMMSEDEQVSQVFLNQAEAVISDLELVRDIEHFRDAIRRDKAQIDHARATILARSLGILEDGAVPKDDVKAIDRATHALELVTAATASFEAIADYERLNKGLALEERLHMALGHRTAAVETHGKRQKVARSLSVRKQ